MLALRIVDDDRLAAGERADRMGRAGWDDTDAAGGDPSGHAADGDLELAFENRPHFLLGVEVLVDRRARVELVVREGHAGRIERASSPARLALRLRQRVDFDKAHDGGSLPMMKRLAGL